MFPTKDDAIQLANEEGWALSFSDESITFHAFKLGTTVKVKDGFKPLNDGHDVGRVVKETKCYVWLLCENGAKPQKKLKKNLEEVTNAHVPYNTALPRSPCSDSATFLLPFTTRSKKISHLLSETSPSTCSSSKNPSNLIPIAAPAKFVSAPKLDLAKPMTALKPPPGFTPNRLGVVAPNSLNDVHPNWVSALVKPMASLGHDFNPKKRSASVLDSLDDNDLNAIRPPPGFTPKPNIPLRRRKTGKTPGRSKPSTSPSDAAPLTGPFTFGMRFQSDDLCLQI